MRKWKAVRKWMCFLGAAVFCLGMIRPAGAETIRLKSGKILEGKVLEQKDREIKMDVDGTVYVVPLDMIDSGKPSAIADRARHRVEVYVTSWCPFCRKLEMFLMVHKIKYERYDVEIPKNGARFDALGGGGVPLVKIGPNIIRGYDPEAILTVLEN